MFRLSIILCMGLLPCGSMAGWVRGTVSLDALLQLKKPIAMDHHFWHLGPIRSNASEEKQALVMLEGAGGKKAKSSQESIQFKEFGVSPALSSITAGSSLLFVNEDKHRYSCKTDGGPEEISFSGLAPGEPIKKVFRSPGTYRLRCQSYPFIQATIVVVKPGFMTTTNEQGIFTIKSVPKGEYTARVFDGQTWRFTTRLNVSATGLTKVSLGPSFSDSSNTAPKTEAKTSSTAQKTERLGSIVTKKSLSEPKSGENRKPKAQAIKPAPRIKPRPTDRKAQTPTRKTKNGTLRKPKNVEKPGFEDVEPEIEIEIDDE
jgi:plastocyanin